MKLHFDPNQQYHLDAVKSIIDLFEGQPLNQGDFGFSISENGQLFNENGVGNKIDISKERILSNLRKIQKKNGLNDIAEKLNGMHFSGLVLTSATLLRDLTQHPNKCYEFT
ncbi:MAG: hypothetical protein K8R49_06630, partial [Candidatus Cloacimonetes bacterium]|nr:hypothetical protein [Candidatus Cloacimonadota bacterium]